jgi:hypothetical protein
MIVSMANKSPNTSKLGTKGGYKKTVQDPRVALFKAYYVDPKSPTFCNINQSALKAGYSQTYALNISVQKPAWWVELMQDADINRAEMLHLSEKNIKRVLKYEPTDKDTEKLQLQTSQFISERLGKEHYSTRQEMTGADGRRLFTNDTRESAKMPLSTLFKGVSQPK